MKQATSDASLSVIVIAAVAMLTAVFFTMIWPMLKDNMYDNSNCSNAVCDIGYIPDAGNAHYGQAMCYNPYDDAREIFYCPFRG